MLFVRNHEAGIDSFGPVREMARHRQKRLDSMAPAREVVIPTQEIDVAYLDSDEHRKWLEHMRGVWELRERIRAKHEPEVSWENAAADLQLVFDFLENIEYPEDPPETKEELVYLQKAFSLADEIEAHASDLQHNELEDGWN